MTTGGRSADSIIDGEHYAPSATYEVVDPTTEEVLAEAADCSPVDVDLAAEAAAKAFPTWSALSLDARRAVLAASADALDSRRDELIELAVRDAGALLGVAASTQVGAAIARLRQWSEMPNDLLAVPSPAPAADLRSTVRRVPVGVVACISPYNFPLLAMVGKVVPALFAGNAVVMKPAPQDPLLVVALAEALRDGLAQVGAPSGAVNLLTGSSAELGSALVNHPAVGSISFTGSTAVGVQIRRDTSAAMKPLLLELGGKGAVVVRADADPAAVVQAVSRTWQVHSGQVCLTPARIIADDAVHDDVVAGLREMLASLRIGDPQDPDTTVGPVISAAQRSRIDALVDSATAEGASVERREDLPSRGFFAAPTLVTDCTPDNTVMREEAFGPVLSVLRSHSDEEAVEVANSTRYALTDYVFSTDVEAGRRIASRLRGAQVGINTTKRDGAAPFGGNHGSGIGRSGGAWSLDHCTTIQTHTEPEAGHA